MIRLSDRETPDATTYALHAARERIAEGIGQIQAEFAHAKTSALRRRQDVLTHRVSLFERILELMGGTLAGALTKFRSHKGWSGTPLELYFWPGYDSIVQRGERASLWWTRPTEKVQCGVGYSIAADGTISKTYRESNSALWFSRVLSSRRADPRTGKTYHPGSTHRWMSQRELRGVTPDGNLRLSALRIGKDAPFDSVAFHVGLLGLDLPSPPAVAWGPYVASQLNNPTCIHQDTIEAWPPPSQGAESDANERALRIKAYSIWLAATLDAALDAGWLLEFAREARELDYPELADTVEEASRAIDEEKNLRRGWSEWYTLRLEGTESTDGSTLESLGTAMLFASERLHPAFLYQATSFANQVYLRLRDFEREGLITRAKTAEGRSQQAAIFAHQTAGQVGALALDPELSRLTPESRFHVWMLRTLTTRLWGTVRFDAFEPADIEFGECGALGWAGQTPRAVFDATLKFGLSHGLLRAAKLPNVTKDNAQTQGVQRRRHVAQQVSDFVDSPTRVEWVAEQLGLALDVSSAPPYANTLGFVIAFYQSLWQAVYHALVTACAEPTRKPYLWFGWTASRFDIFNRSPRDETGLETRPRDCNFLDLFNHRQESRRRFRVDGPLRHDDTSWRTSIVCVELPES
jgi:hypothetical protein